MPKVLILKSPLKCAFLHLKKIYLYYLLLLPYEIYIFILMSFCSYSVFHRVDRWSFIERKIKCYFFLSMPSVKYLSFWKSFLKMLFLQLSKPVLFSLMHPIALNILGFSYLLFPLQGHSSISGVLWIYICHGKGGSGAGH